MLRWIFFSASMVGLTVGGGMGLSYAHSHTMSFGVLAGDVETETSELAPQQAASSVIAPALSDLAPVRSTVELLDMPSKAETAPTIELAALDSVVFDAVSQETAPVWSAIPGPRPVSLDLAGRRDVSKPVAVARRASTPVRKQTVVSRSAPLRVAPAAEARAVAPKQADLVVVVRDGRRLLAKPNAERTAVMVQSAPRYSVGVYR